MTARPLVAPRKAKSIRVIEGRRRERPRVAVWLVYTVVAAVAFFGLIYSQTRLNASALRIQELQAEIADEQDKFEDLRLTVARLESPARVDPAAEDLGMIFPSETRTLTAPGVVADGSADGERIAQWAATITATSP